MAMTVSLVGMLLSLGLVELRAQTRDTGSGYRLFAAVFLVRGSVSGGNVGSYGLFIRDGNDSAWTKATKSNVISFGLGHYRKSGTERYYLAAGNGLHRSTDGGKSWQVITAWTTEEILGVVTDPVDSEVIYVATPLGVSKTTDDGKSWIQKREGFKKRFIQRIILDCRNRRTLYAASEDDIYKTTNAGDQWFPLHAGASNPLALIQNPDTPNQFVAGFEDGGLKYSFDDGLTWLASKDLAGSSIYTLRYSASGNDIYAAGWKTGLWRSEDRGVNWKRIWSDPSFEAIYTVAVDPGDAKHVLVGSVGKGVYESRDRGETWKNVGLPGAQVKQLEFYP